MSENCGKTKEISAVSDITEIKAYVESNDPEMRPLMEKLSDVGCPWRETQLGVRGAEICFRQSSW